MLAACGDLEEGTQTFVDLGWTLSSFLTRFSNSWQVIIKTEKFGITNLVMTKPVEDHHRDKVEEEKGHPFED